MPEDSSTETYRKLLQFFDEQPEGFPKDESLADIKNLQQMFTPEQAEIEIHMRSVPEHAGIIAERCGKPVMEVEEVLESMVADGLILHVLSKEESCYMMRNLWSVFWKAGDRTIEPGKKTRTTHAYA